MLTETVKRLSYLMDHIPALLAAIPDEVFRQKTVPDKWSKLEILGHLTDSAANNHHRFIRLQFEDVPVTGYDQNNWVKYSYHQNTPKAQLIHFWETYNRHILYLIQQITPELLLKKCIVTGGDEVTLQWLIEDYVVHMEHHLKQIMAYS